MNKSLAIIMLNWNGTQDTIESLQSLKDNIETYDIFLLDNASKENQIEQMYAFLKEDHFFNTVIETTTTFCGKGRNEEPQNLYYIISDENMGFAGGNNYIADQLKQEYDYLLLLNNDTVVVGDAIASMLNLIRAKKHVAVTCDIRYFSEPDVLWNAGGDIMWYGDRKYYPQSMVDEWIRKGIEDINAQFITGCALLIDSEYIRANGLFTDKFFHGEEDYNFCMNVANRGGTLGVDLTAKIYHKVGRSIAKHQNNPKQLRGRVVHYTNRVIDYKHILDGLQWKLWRELYLLLITVKAVFSRNSDLKTAIHVAGKVRSYSNKYDHVRKDVFMEIMSDSEIA